MAGEESTQYNFDSPPQLRRKVDQQDPATSEAKEFVGAMLENPDNYKGISLSPELFNYDEFFQEYVRQEQKTLKAIQQHAQDESHIAQIRRDLFPISLDRTFDILSLKKRAVKAESDAYTDTLTGLYGQEYYRNVFPELLEEILRSGNQASLVMVDVDNFKEYNDKYGHPYGDDVLKKVSQVLQQTLRPGDVIIRRGGDEFLIILEDIDTVTVTQIAERLREKAKLLGEDNELTEGKDVTFSFSIGISTGNSQTTPKVLEKESDIAMYQSKKTKDAVTVFKEGMEIPELQGRNSTDSHRANEAQNE